MSISMGRGDQRAASVRPSVGLDYFDPVVQLLRFHLGFAFDDEIQEWQIPLSGRVVGQ